MKRFTDGLCSRWEQQDRRSVTAQQAIGLVRYVELGAENFIYSAERNCRHAVLWNAEEKLRYVRFEDFAAVTMKKAVYCDVAPPRYCVTDISEERIASIFRVEENKIRKSASKEPAGTGVNILKSRL
jgi:hypothetical protein